jgi:hypothetical protein
MKTFVTVNVHNIITEETTSHSAPSADWALLDEESCPGDEDLSWVGEHVRITYTKSGYVAVIA